MSEQLRKLPLWRSTAEEMIEAGVNHGQTFDAQFFKEHLACEPDTIEFSMGISNIRRELEKKGFYLSGQGGKGERWTILPPQDHADVMQRYSAAALDALKRGVILGTNTRLDLLSDSDRRRHESMLEKLATRAVLLLRSKTVIKALGKNRKLLE